MLNAIVFSMLPNFKSKNNRHVLLHTAHNELFRKNYSVIPAQAGIQKNRLHATPLDSGVGRNDGAWEKTCQQTAMIPFGHSAR